MYPLTTLGGQSVTLCQKERRECISARSLTRDSTARYRLITQLDDDLLGRVIMVRSNESWMPPETQPVGERGRSS